MTIRKSLSFAALVAMLVVTASAEEPDPADPIGRPKYKNGQSTRYVVWHDNDGWHLRTTTSADSTVFAGSIEVVGGKMVNLQPVAAEGKEGSKKKPNPKSADYGTWNAAQTVFQFKFSTRTGGSDGFDMRVSDKATAMKFVLKVNDAEKPAAIFLGAKNAHPKEGTFTLPAHPGK